MSKSVSEKLGVKKGRKAILVRAPQNFANHAHLPSLDLKSRLAGAFDYIHFFALKASQLKKRLPILKRHLDQKGMLWISWPKARQLGTDLTLKKVVEIGYSHGLVESKGISIDEIWSALKFTFPIAGRKYNNSHANLKT